MSLALSCGSIVKLKSWRSIVKRTPLQATASPLSSSLSQVYKPASSLTPPHVNFVMIAVTSQLKAHDILHYAPVWTSRAQNGVFPSFLYMPWLFITQRVNHSHCSSIITQKNTSSCHCTVLCCERVVQLLAVRLCASSASHSKSSSVEPQNRTHFLGTHHLKLQYE